MASQYLTQCRKAKAEAMKAASNPIPAPKLDMALVQSERLLKQLQIESYGRQARTDREYMASLRTRIHQLSQWIAQRRRNPVLPAEHRPKFHGSPKGEPVGYKHPGVSVIHSFPMKG